MKKILPIILVLCVLVAHSQEEWDLNTPGQITYLDGDLGLGTTSPDSKLHVQADAKSGGEGIIRLSVSDASPDYLTLSNSTGAGGQFIPLIRGHRETDNRVSFQIIGQTSASMDSGTQPLLGFSARVDNNFVNTRPLFQWSNFTSKKMTMLSNGDLGLGTTSPNSRLHVQADAKSGGEGIIRLSVSDASSDYLTLSNSTGAGGQFIPLIRGHHETDNRVSFQIIGQTSASMDSGTQPLLGFSARVDNNFVNTSPLFQWSNFTSKKMTMLSNGNLGIGTTSPDEKLTVKGTIHAEEVKVDLSAPGPDYVFEPTYDLRSLEEIEQYIQSEKHLPEIPSAKEMEANGVQLGEMNMLLLRKIEELTLHTIAQEKRITQLEPYPSLLKESEAKQGELENELNNLKRHLLQQERLVEAQGKMIEELKKEIKKNTKKSIK